MNTTSLLEQLKQIDEQSARYIERLIEAIQSYGEKERLVGDARLNISDGKDQVIVRIDLPGTSKEDITLTQENCIVSLAVKGQPIQKLQLRGELDLDKAHGIYKDGRLAFVIPKMALKSRTIPID